MLKGPLCINNGVPTDVTRGAETMAKQGALQDLKHHGRARDGTYGISSQYLVSTDGVFSISGQGPDESTICFPNHALSSSISLLPDASHYYKENGAEKSDSSTLLQQASRPAALVGEETMQTFVPGKWLKSKDSSLSQCIEPHNLERPNPVVSILEMDSKDNSAMDTALFTVIGSDSDLTDHLQDLVFSAALQDAVDKPVDSQIGDDTLNDGGTMCASNANARFHSSNQNFIVTTKSEEASHGQPFHSDSLNDPQISNSRSISMSPVRTISNSISLGSIQNILLQSSPAATTCDNLRQFPPSVGSSEYTASSFSPTVKKENLMSYEGSHNSIILSHNESSLPLSGVTVDPSLSNLCDTSELNLNNLPNFLGLDSNSTSSISNLLDTQPDNLLEPSASSISLTDQPMIKTEFLQSTKVSELSGQDINVTTISISNDDKNATKIMVNTNQGQQQMYVISASDLTQHQGTKLDSNHSQPMFVINASDFHSSDSSEQKPLHSVSVSVEHDQILASPEPPAAPVAEIPGFILVPVVDNASNVIQTMPVQAPSGDPNAKKSQKNLLQCSEPGCNKMFKKASKLKVHEMLHTGERPYKCTLLGCEWAFTTAHKLKRHMESHEGRKDFVCDYPGCEHRFTTVYNLNTHRKLHERPCVEPCWESGCNMSFPTKRQLDLHLRNVHAYEERTFECPEPGCDKVFFSSTCMGSHMRVHQQRAEDLRCKFPGCGKMFTKICRLRQHERLHTGERPFICDFEGCSWAFATASKLKRHQTKHTGVRKWVCPECKKQFHRSEHLKGHLITHSGARPFVCPVEGCGNTFTAKSSLYVHLKNHDESEKTIVYHCPMEKCERHYASKASLRQHILVKHCVLPQKGSSTNQGVVNWLSVLGSGDGHSEVNTQHGGFNDGEGVDQSTLSVSQDSMLATDFLTESIPEQTLLSTSGDAVIEQSCNNLISQLMVSSGITPSSTSAAIPAPIHLNQQQQQQQQDLLQEQHIQQQLLEAEEILQQQDRILREAVERGRRSQIMLENMNGSARTDFRSNNIISQRALKRWQKQKEVEAAKLGAQLEAQNAINRTSSTSVASVVAPDFRNAVSNNVSLGGQQQQFVHTILLARQAGARKDAATVKVEIPDMELQAEGISETVLDGRTSVTDAFMTELFVRDPETGITYRQTQLLQDDPPNPDMLEEMEDVAPTHNMVLDSALGTQFEDDSLHFQDLE